MFFSDEINKSNDKEIKEIRDFLNKYDVIYDNPDKTFVIRDSGKIIATGSASGNILKYFFSDEEYQGQGTMSIIYNSLLNYLIESNIPSFFVFTTSCNKLIFESLGLTEVYSTDRVALFEGGFYNYSKWIKEVKSSIKDKEGKRGAMVVNCNPMTLGHKYVIEKALENVDELLVFVVEEDQSIFPFIDRFNILKNELSNNDKITLIKGGPYIISQGTFPTYFIKRKDEMLDIYTKLDGSIFADKIAKDLEIDIRFFGSEPTDVVTLAYNNSMKEILRSRGIEVKIFERKSLDDIVISASWVRKLIKEDRMEEAFGYLPNSTIEFLKSDKGSDVIKKIQGE
ncbi:MAG: adenylyltransferase/cytidyltransferase family protein [Tissierella sp.]|nr:adenylyltransferase/cytidyltransferase family protein [Tissierella sp.]